MKPALPVVAVTAAADYRARLCRSVNLHASETGQNGHEVFVTNDRTALLLDCELALVLFVELYLRLQELGIKARFLEHVVRHFRPRSGAAME
jgi:hypothetical protein